jgi:TonB family protein
MSTRLVLLVIFASLGILTSAESKGFCPPFPPKPKLVAPKTSVPPTPPSPDAQYAGTVMVMAVVSDKGYVCHAEVVRGLEKEVDKKAVGAVRQWHLQPARKDGRPVSVVVIMEVSYWRKDSALIQYPLTPTLMGEQDESPN